MKKFLSFFALVFLLSVNTTYANLDLPYSDVDSLYEHHNVLEFMYNRNIMTGYPDGTFQPERVLNRAELLKIIIEAKYDESDYGSYDGQDCFTDIITSEWYVKYVCYGKAVGIVEGYPDGSFIPGQDVNLVEALKMMLLGMGINVPESSSGEWYAKYYETAQAHYLIPEGLENQYTSKISRVNAAKVLKGIISLDAEILQPPVYTTEGGYEPGSVYLGYLQEGNVLEIYLIADSNINEDLIEGGAFKINNNEVLDNSSAGSIIYANVNDTISVNVWNPLRTNEVRHVVTLYLENNTPVDIEVVTF